MTDDGQALSKKTDRVYKPGIFAPHWNPVSNTVGPSVNAVESNFRPTVKKEGLTITADGKVKGHLKRKRDRVKVVGRAK